MDDDEPWQFTVLRAQGLHYLRNETWRPIITLELDAMEHVHETVLGTDGQNTNQKIPFILHSVHAGSKFELKVWHRSQTKKKAKKRTLVAASSCQSLGELWKKQQEQTHQKSIELRLQCQNKTKSCTSITPKNKIRSGPAVYLRLQPPISFLRPPSTTTVDTDFEPSDILTVHSPSSSSSSDDEDGFPLDPIDITGMQYEESQLGKKKMARRRKGFKVFSDEESEYEEYDELEEIRRRLGVEEPGVGIVDPEELEVDEREARWSRPGWIVASFLPAHFSHAKPDRRNTEDMGHIEKVVDHCTVYRRLRRCETDSEFENAHSILVQEWKYSAGMLIGLAAVDVTVFAITPDAILPVDSNMRKVLALSSVLSAAGFFSSCNLLFWYGYVGSVHSFRKDILDQYDSYFFFSISSRVPALCMLGASTSLFVLFIMIVAQAWVIVIFAAGAFVGVLSSLHFWHRSVWALARWIRSLFVWAKTKRRAAVVTETADAIKSEEKCWDADADTLRDS